MNKKRIIKVITLIIVLVVLAGCAPARDAEGNIKLISLSTPFSDMREEGIFSAILIYPLSQAINFLSNHLGVGLAIMIVTLLLNAVVLVMTFKSSVSMQKMQDLQPELNKIQRKYEGRDDAASKQKMNMELSRVYQKYNVNPVTALLSSFLQFPILIAMYNAVQRSYAVANGVFMGVDLSLSPTQNLSNGVYGGVIIYAIMLILQFLSVSIMRWLTNARAKKEAEKHHRHYEKPQEPNAMMSYGMLVFIGFLMLNWPCALSLYYAIYSLVNILKTIIVDKLTHKEEA